MLLALLRKRTEFERKNRRRNGEGLFFANLDDSEIERAGVARRFPIDRRHGWKKREIEEAERLSGINRF